MPEESVPQSSEIPSGLRVWGLVMISDEEIATLHALVGEDLVVSSTLRAWFGGDEDLPPHSIGVALEAQLRMLFDDPAEACEILVVVLDRLAEAFPSDVQPLDTT